jgi:hypothetical protein
MNCANGDVAGVPASSLMTSAVKIVLVVEMFAT